MRPKFLCMYLMHAKLTQDEKYFLPTASIQDLIKFGAKLKRSEPTIHYEALYTNLFLRA